MKVLPFIEESWMEVLKEEFKKPYMLELKEFLIKEKQSIEVYPKGIHIFNAFNLTPFPRVRVVILGQDPYHGPDQAHGLSFSVLPPTKPPPSLKNIYKELETDLGIAPPDHGDLTSWAKQGVLLLNTVLTVQSNNAGSHRGKGWEEFTTAVIQKLVEKKKNLVFILWGKDAQSKMDLITGDHLVIKSAHPSPFAARKGFFGSKPFSQTNKYLKETGQPEINFQL